MQPRELESLRERLLRAGLAPRHVRRYIRELRDHYDDALQAELTNEADVATARQRASARLGAEDDLARSMLERPELRSMAARFPALVFGVGPSLAWLGVVFATALALGLLPRAHAPGSAPSAWLLDAAHALCISYIRVLPVLLAMVALRAAAERRLRAHWPLAGAALVDLLTGTLTANLMATSGQLGVSSSLLPLLVPSSDLFGPIELRALGAGLMRAACMLAVSVFIHLLWTRASRRVQQGRPEQSETRA